MARSQAALAPLPAFVPAALRARPAPAVPAAPVPAPVAPSQETDEAIDRAGAPALIFGTVAAGYVAAVGVAGILLASLPVLPLV